jgi:hypothetical protein
MADFQRKTFLVMNNFAAPGELARHENTPVHFYIGVGPNFVQVVPDCLGEGRGAA